jgi:hypothetical protein
LTSTATGGTLKEHEEVVLWKAETRPLGGNDLTERTCKKKKKKKKFTFGFNGRAFHETSQLLPSGAAPFPGVQRVLCAPMGQHELQEGKGLFCDRRSKVHDYVRLHPKGREKGTRWECSFVVLVIVCVSGWRGEEGEKNIEKQDTG